MKRERYPHTNCRSVPRGGDSDTLTVEMGIGIFWPHSWQRPFCETAGTDPSEKKRIKTVTSGVGQMIGVPVDDRLEFIYKLIPNNETPFIVDEMIRVSDQSDLTKISDWLKKRGYSSARTELYRLIVDRMQRLGSDNQQIQAFIDSLEYDDEQTRVRKALADPSDVPK